MANDTGVVSPEIVKGCAISMDVDSKNTDPEYWERVLQACNLSMNRGKFLKGAGEVMDAGDSADVDSLTSYLAVKRTGRVIPPGHGPDD